MGEQCARIRPFALGLVDLDRADVDVAGDLLVFFDTEPAAHHGIVRRRVPRDPADEADEADGSDAVSGAPRSGTSTLPQRSPRTP